MEPMKQIKLASLVLVSTVFVAAGNSTDAPREGLWLERSVESREPVRPIIGSVVTERPSGVLTGAASTARKFLPKAPIPKGGPPGKELRVMLPTARVAVYPGETFLFVFSETRSTVWKMGADVASHPKDFVIVPLEAKDRLRKASLDSTGMFKNAVFSDFTVEEISPTQFRVSLPPTISPGEYAWVYVGSGALKAGLRLFDFKLEAAKANPAEGAAGLL